MRLLRVKLKKARCFKNGFDLLLCNSDGIRSSANTSRYDMPVFQVKEAIYTQVVMGVVGLNATGKTTILEIISLVLHVIFEHIPLNYPEAQRILGKIIPENAEPIEWSVVFEHEKHIYELVSVILLNHDTGLFEYSEETICCKRLTSKTSRRDLFDFSACTVKTREEEKNNPFLNKYVTIAVAVGEYRGKIYSTEKAVNFNVPYWRGRPDPRLIQCFDPNIEDIRVQGEDSGNHGTKMVVSFKNQKGMYSGDGLLVGNFLSSGTIKGLSLLPLMLEVFKNGGYLIVDELENHLNKKLVEWFFEMFSDNRINPKGACLIFSTHYPELLDSFDRKDNILVTRRDEENFLRCGLFSDEVKRNELSKSRVILSNVIKGTAPSFEDIQRAKRCMIDEVKKGI